MNQSLNNYENIYLFTIKIDAFLAKLKTEKIISYLYI